MYHFTDAAGRDWSIELTLGLVNRIAHTNQVDLLTATDDDLAALTKVSRSTMDVVWTCIERQAAEAAVTKLDFVEGLNSVAMLDAAYALWQAMTDFFRNDQTLLERWSEITRRESLVSTPPETTGTPSTDSAGSSDGTGGP